MKTQEEIRALVSRAANEDWSFAELASVIEHSEGCAKKMTLASFCGQPLTCECSKGTV
jgi:hypothetical protein